MTPTVVTYTIDASDVLTDVGGAWDRSALAGNAPALLTTAVGRPLWDFISDDTTRQIYRELLTRVRLGREVEFPYRCDDPTARREMVMRMRSLELGHVRFESTLVAESPFSRPAADTPRLPASRLTRICSWCKRVALGDGWLELDVAIERLALFDAAPHSPISHAMCPSCEADMNRHLIALL